FFQAEDGIRDLYVTGVQTCALPILTAAAASLALIPIAREGFWAPMAFAMMGGIIVGTLLTLLFLPALYIAWFRVKPPVEAIKEPAPTKEPTPTEPALQPA